MPLRDPDDNLAVQFLNVAMPNDDKSRLAGRPIFDDVELCCIRVPGQRDTKYFPPTAFAKWDIDPLTGQQRAITYAERFPRQYQQFKAKAAQTISGTPLEFALFMTEAKRAELRAQNVYTIETLAAIEGTELKNLGPGGRELKNRAQKFIDDAKVGAADQQMQRELELQNARNATLVDDNNALRERLAAMSASPATPFDDMSDQQLRDYVTANTGKEPQGALPRKTLLRMAAETTNKAA